jgi:hypothetical protein
MKKDIMSISETILVLAIQRGSQKTICPSEVARKLWPGNWRPHMEAVRKAAFNLRKEGKVRILQIGVDVNDHEVVGPIRIAIAD